MTRAGFFIAVTYLVWNFPILRNVFGSSNAGQRFYFLVVLGVTALCVVFSSGRIDRRMASYLAVFVVAICYYGLSMVLTVEVLLNLAEGIGRPVVYMCGFIVGALTARHVSPERYLRVMMTIFYINIVLCVLPFVPMGSFAVDFFKGRLSTDLLASLHYFRWTGTFAYPTDFSFYLIVVMLMAYFNRHLLSRREFVAVNTLSLVAVLFSVSRIAFGALAVVLPILYRRRFLLALPLLAAAIPVALAVMPEEQFRYIETGFALTGKLDASALHRARELGLAFDPRHLSLFGYGPRDARLYAEAVVIEGWLPYHLLVWGGVGFVFFLLMSATLFVLSWPSLKAREPWMLTFWAAFTVAIVLFGPFSAVIDRFKMPFLLFSLLGAASQWRAKAENVG